MSEELKPCPFCGSEYTQVRYMGGKLQETSAFSSGYRGECCDCGFLTAAFYTEAEAVKAWNTRSERTCHNDNAEGSFVCSECGAHVRDTYVGVSYGDENGKRWYSTSTGQSFKYCPNCGVKVVEE